MPKKIFCLSLSLCFVSLLFASSAALAGFLQGNVNETDVRTGPKGPAMNRTDLQRDSDPFAEEASSPPVNQSFDAPAASFALPNIQPHPAARMFPLNAQDGGQANFTTMQAQPDNSAQMHRQNPQTASVQQVGDPNDPDANSQSLQLAWDQWHHNVAQAVYQRFSQFSNMAFSHGPPLSVSVAYTVTRDCQIQNLILTQKSPNFLFNTMILTVIKSLSGDTSLLTFPPGSRRMSVEKSGTFAANTGFEGFKYLTGDRETVRH